MDQSEESQREGEREWVDGRQSTKDFVCKYAWPMDTVNGAMRAWGWGLWGGKGWKGSMWEKVEMHNTFNNKELVQTKKEKYY